MFSTQSCLIGVIALTVHRSGYIIRCCLKVLALSPLICLSAGALSIIIIGLIKNTRAATLVSSFIALPQMFLSGVIIPINHSSGVLLVLSRIMPMTYCLDLTRAVVYAGTPEYHSVVLFHPLVNLVVIIVLTAVFLSLGTYLFARSETHK